MPVSRVPQRIFALLSALTIGVTILTGCERPPYVREDAFAVTSELFSPDDFKHTRERDGTGRLEILHASTAHRTLNVLFLEAYQNAVISDHAIFPRLVMRGWKVLQGKNIEFGIKGRVETPGGFVDFERFSYASNSCFAFHSTYQPSGFDTQSRYAKLVAGYYCHTMAAPLVDAAVAKFLSSITVPKFDFVKPLGELSANIYYEPVQALKFRAIRPGRS